MRRERELEAQQQKDAAERKAREKAERKARVGEKGSASPLVEVLIPGNAKRILAACAAVCIVILAITVVRHWSFYAGVKWVPLSGGSSVNLYSLAASSDGKTLYTCGYGSVFLNSLDGGGTWIDRGTGLKSSCRSMFASPDGSRVALADRQAVGVKVVESTDRGANLENAQ